MRTKRLTKSVVDNLPPKERSYIIYCPALSGFGVRVMPTGRKAYVARYRTLAGVERLQTIARTTHMSVDAAREEAIHLFLEARRGNDPTQERRAVRQSERLSDVFDRYQREASAYKKKTTVGFNAAQWKHLVRHFGNMNVRTITAEQIRDFMIEHAHHKPTANNAYSVLKKLLNYARVSPNPCDGVPLYRIERPHRVLSTAELRRIDEALDTFPDYFILLIRLLMLTGCRLREIMHAHTAWVDLERRTLSLPDSKTGAKVIHLPAAACALLHDCHTRRYIIQEVGRNAPVAHPYKSWYRLCKRCGLTGVRMHDFRHTYGSRAHMAGLSQVQIAHLLGHSSLQTTEKYLHYIEGDISPVEVAAAAMKSPAMKAPP